MRTNEEIRKTVELSGVRYWEIASRLNIHEANLCRKLRRELSADEKDEILSIVRMLREERERALANA